MVWEEDRRANRSVMCFFFFFKVTINLKEAVIICNVCESLLIARHASNSATHVKSNELCLYPHHCDSQLKSHPSPLFST